MSAEANLQRAIIDLLEAEKVFHLRLNSGSQLGSYTSKKTGKVSKWRIKLCPEGTPDLVLFLHWHMSDSGEIKQTRVVWVELKAPGGRQTPAQASFEQKAIKEGHSYFIFDAIDKFQAWLKVNR